MAQDTSEIDRVVREVMARLNIAATPSQPAAPAATPGELVLAARVVSVEEVNGRLKGIRRVVVTSKAVVTPAVLDLLRERKIDLARGAAASGAKAAAAGRVVVGVAETNFEPAGLLRTLGQTATIERLAKSGLKSVVNEMADHVSRGGALGVLLTGRAAAALCLANRVHGVRAVSGSEASAIAKAVQETAANVLVVDPAVVGAWAVQRAVSVFCGAGMRPCPAELA